MSDLNDKLVSGLKWGSVEKFSTYGVQFLLSIVMARLLTPADFGVVGMITIFLALSTIFIDRGFARRMRLTPTFRRSSISTSC